MNTNSTHIKPIVFGIALGIIIGCQSPSNTNKEAKKGAKYGAVSGAVSGFFWGLFSGDPLERAAQGAVVGAGTGATMGAIHGSQTDKKLKTKYGETNFKALMELINKNYLDAQKLADQAQKSSNVEHQKAALWLSVLIAKETGEPQNVLHEYYTKLIKLDSTITTEKDAEAKANQALGKLAIIREKQI